MQVSATQLIYVDIDPIELIEKLIGNIVVKHINNSYLLYVTTDHNVEELRKHITKEEYDYYKNLLSIQKYLISKRNENRRD